MTGLKIQYIRFKIKLFCLFAIGLSKMTHPWNNFSIARIIACEMLRNNNNNKLHNFNEDFTSYNSMIMNVYYC